MNSESLARMVKCSPKFHTWRAVVREIAIIVMAA